MAFRLRISVPVAALAAGSLLLAGGAAGTPAAGDETELEPATALEQAQEESGGVEGPARTHRLPAGELRVTPTELLASASGQRIRFSLKLERPVHQATLVVTLPRTWVRRVASGVPTTRPAALVRRAGGAARLRRSGRSVELSLEQAGAGAVASFEIADVGVPAGTYRLPFSWREQDRPAPAGPRPTAGVARVVFFAPVREARGGGAERLADPGQEVNASDDSIEESETFIAVTQGDSDRIAVGSNWGLASMPAWISDDAGQTWTPRALPESIDAPNKAQTENGNVCCDPMFAADGLGNIWFGGLSFKKGNAPSRIVVNRIAAGGNNFQSLTAGLPVRTNGTQDKPMMTIDNAPASPTFGRLYVVWDEPAAGGINLVISQCDTRPGGVLNAARCDNADNWSTPASVTPTTGSYIYADVAVGPDGRAYVTWWDYSSANAIRGDVCNPSSQNCAGGAGWGTPQTIAILDSTGGTPIPFACPIIAQPGGRAAPAPAVDVDHSGGANHGRVYVSWGDLRPGSGSTRCSEDPITGAGAPPLATHLTWDGFVASAAGGALPGGAAASTSVGTRLLTDGEGAGSSDDWFPWLAVDQTSGQAWADFYSTRDDATRETTNFYARSVTASGGGHALGTLTRVSTAPSDYSENTCCTFGNDYGDYTGIDATSSIAYPVWTDNSTGEGEAFTFVEQLVPPPGVPPTVSTGAATGIGQNTATLNGTVNPNGQSTSYHFDYGTTTAYGSQAPVPDGNGGSGGTNQAVSTPLSGLTAATTYHFRLVAQNASGTSIGADQTFTTASPPPPNSPPDVITGAADSIGQTTATLHGTVNPNGQATTFHFDYGVDAGPATVYAATPNQSAGSGTSDLAVSADLDALDPATTYRYRLVADNGAPGSPTTGAEATFETAPGPPPPFPPTVTTGGADAVGISSAIVHGTVNPNGQSTTYRFVYGTGASYGLSAPVPDAQAGSGTSDQAVSASLSGLFPATTYHYRLVATNPDGVAAGEDASFSTGLLDLIGPSVVISRQRLRLGRRGVALRLGCPDSEPDPSCEGTLRLRTARRVPFHGERRKARVGRRSFEIPAGEAERIFVRLAPALRRLLRELAPLRLLAIATARDLAGNSGTSRRRLRLFAP